MSKSTKGGKTKGGAKATAKAGARKTGKESQKGPKLPGSRPLTSRRGKLEGK